MTWLGGVLEHEGVSSLEALDLYTECAVLDGIDEPKTLAILKEHPADVYLFSPLTPNLSTALTIADMIKRLYPRSLVIFGGVVASPLHEQVARHPSVDYVVVGKGEYALPHLLYAIQHPESIEEVGQLTYRNRRGDIVVHKRAYPLMPLNELPFPKIDLFPRDYGENIRYIRQVYADGCPFRCAFCSAPGHGRRPSYFPIARVLSEIAAYRSYYGEHHHFYFGDLTFTYNTERTLALCDALKAQQGVLYDCQTRLGSLHDARLPKALYESGCRWLEFGMETFNQTSLDLFKQRTSVAQVEDILARLRDNGIAACTSMLIGLPNESPDDMRRSMDQICSLIGRGLLHASYVFNLVPYPGTRLYEESERFGVRLRHNDLSLFREDLVSVFDSPYATAEQIYSILLEGIQNIASVMEQRPAIGEIPSEDATLGGFWMEAHP